jgi:hypothetical protein
MLFNTRNITPDHVDIFSRCETLATEFEWYYNLLPKAFPLESYIHWQQVLASIIYLSFNNRDLFMPFYTYLYTDLAHLQEASIKAKIDFVLEDIPFLAQMDLLGCTCFDPTLAPQLKVEEIESIISDLWGFDFLMSDIPANGHSTKHLETRADYVRFNEEIGALREAPFDFFNRGPKRTCTSVTGDPVELYGTRFDMTHIGIHTADRIGAFFEDIAGLHDPLSHISAFTVYLLTGNVNILSMAHAFGTHAEATYIYQAMRGCWRLFVNFWSDSDVMDIRQIRHLLYYINKKFRKIFIKVFKQSLKPRHPDAFYIPIQDFLSRHDSSSAVMRRILRYIVVANRNPMYADAGLHYPALYAYLQLLCDEFGLVNNRDVHFDTFYSRPSFSYPLVRVHWLYSFFIERMFYNEELPPVSFARFGSMAESSQSAKNSSDLIWKSIVNNKVSSDADQAFLLNYLRLNSYDAFDFMCNVLALLGKS